MNKEGIDVAQSVQEAYDQQYAGDRSEWRQVGGKYKARNILDLCKGHEFKKVMDCGAGEGSVLSFVDASGEFSELFATEISDSAIAHIESRALPSVTEIKKFDGHRIPYSDEFFDMVYCSHVVEHVEHPRILIREIARVSKFQIYEVPLDYHANIDSRIDYFLGYGHINVYTPSLFRFLLKSEGHEIITEKLTHVPLEVARYVKYGTQKKNKTALSEARFKLLPALRFLKRKVYGQKLFDEHGYAAYTCLTRRTGALNVL